MSTYVIRRVSNNIKFMLFYSFLRVNLFITLTEEQSLKIISIFTTVRTSNITKIRVFINKLMNIIFGAKIYGVKG
jgi:hypothetical protein